MLPPSRSSVAQAAHTALVAAARLGWTGTLVVARTPAGVRARLEGTAQVVPPAPAPWGQYQHQAVVALAEADRLQPLGAWEWAIRLQGGVPAAGLTWRGLDSTPDIAV